MTWVKDQYKLDRWEVVLIQNEVEACYAERAKQASSKENN